MEQSCCGGDTASASLWQSTQLAGPSCPLNVCSPSRQLRLIDDQELPASAVMEWTDGDEWSLTVPLPPGVTDFKCVVVRADGSIAEWEPGANRNIEVRWLGCS